MSIRTQFLKTTVRKFAADKPIFSTPDIETKQGSVTEINLY